MRKPVNEAQLRVLRWVASGSPGGEPSDGDKHSARALASRRLLTIRGRGAMWRASLTDDGRYFAEHGTYPADPQADPTPSAPVRGTKKEQTPEPIPEWEVDSPRGKREAGRRPKGDDLFSDDRSDPFDERILISVKEAGWLLSLPEDTIRRAVRLGDLDRVYIGEGKTHYRVVYGSLLAWVNDMPREPALRSWWR